MTFVDVAATVLIGVLAGGLSVLAGGGVTVVLPVLLALGLSADQANATSRFNLTVGAVIATIVLIRKKRSSGTRRFPCLSRPLRERSAAPSSVRSFIRMQC
jgi:uncharacterized membrane protein YfcA